MFELDFFALEHGWQEALAHTLRVLHDIRGALGAPRM
jgi:hypothetical protein